MDAKQEVLTYEEMATKVADQCKPCSVEFYSGIKQGVILALNASKDELEKARKWNNLDERISKFYPEDGNDEEDGDLVSIGEIAASAFGYL